LTRWRDAGRAGQDGTSDAGDLTSDLSGEQVSSNESADIEMVSADEIGISAETSSPEEDAEIVPEEEEVLDPYTYRLETSDDGTVTFVFAGDILFDPAYAIFATYRQRGEQIEQCISEDLLEEMRSADVMMINNEFPYSYRGEPVPDKTYTFRASPESVSVLYDMGVDIVALANNHAYDYGEDAFLDTLDTLEQAEMPYVGAGRNLEEAVQPVYYLVGDSKIAVLSATQIERTASPHTVGATEDTPGVFRCLETELLEEKIREAKEECDFVIVYIHWGTESTDELDWRQRNDAPLYVEAGADIIIGDHPHCLQEIGYIDGVPVIYSLGNFWFNSRTMDSCIVKMTLSEDGIQSLQFVPCLQSNCSVSLLEGTERARVISYMQGISSTANIDQDGFVTPTSAE
ncbi:MAG: CapA family protein, partial [Lachnospiraceae bacterium]|nr:CapA family protein [Lachnospiraceae bacterium]